MNISSGSLDQGDKRPFDKADFDQALNSIHLDSIALGDDPAAQAVIGKLQAISSRVLVSTLSSAQKENLLKRIEDMIEGAQIRGHRANTTRVLYDLH